MTASKLRLDLPLLLPEGADACRRCVTSLVSGLEGRTGVERVHVEQGGGDTAAALCIHYDPDALSLAKIEAVARQSGAEIGQRYGHATFRLADVTHARAATRIADRLRGLQGVIAAEVSPAGFATVEFDKEKVDEPRVRQELVRAGARLVAPVEASSKAAHAHAPGEAHDHKAGRAATGEHGHRHGGLFGERSELVFAVLSGLSLAVGWFLQGRAPGAVSVALYVAAYGFGGYFTLREALGNLRNKRFEIDTLMLVAAAGAAALGEWAEGALLLFLFSLGHALEHYAMGRARRAIEALAELAPEIARVRRGEEVVEVGVEDLTIDDVVLVRPNERMPADGVVIEGESSVNQAPVTGESVPVDKQPIGLDFAKADFSKIDQRHRVYAGTINGAGALEVRVARLAAQSTLARVVQMVAEAEAQRSPTQRFTDRFERVFVPSILVLVGALMFAWLVIDEPFADSFYRAMAVLVAASPCALAISVPSAVLSGVARAGRGGVLVKGGGPLEDLGTLSAIAFDKTGTLTEGKPKVTDVVAWDGVAEAELLSVAVALEQHSDHPLAAAVVRDGRTRLGAAPIPAVSQVESLTGRGIRGVVGGQSVLIGKPSMFETESPQPGEWLRSEVERLERTGRTVMVVRHGERDLGLVGLMDTPRGPARQMIADLRRLGIRRMVMLSGDNQQVANAVAAELGLDEAKGALMPEDKVTFLKALREQEGKVAMVGDGVNDAPALAAASVGVAMGAAGSDVALETADVALMADDLRHLPFAVGLSRRTSGIIKQNLWVSLGVVAFLIPATLFGLKIGAAVIFHEGSTLLVVLNALRLLAYRDQRDG